MKHAASMWTTMLCLVLGVGTSVLVLPHVLDDPHPSIGGPDSLGYIATAYNWIEGRGFVDPTVYSYYVPDLHPPAPAVAIRPPVLSVLLAPLLWAGAGVTGIAVAHAIWASILGACGLLVAQRDMTRVAAVTFAIAVAWSPGWVFVSRYVWTEATAVGFLLLFIACIGRGLRSSRGACALAALAVLGWLTRPNLGIVVPALILASLLENGPRAALRSKTLWTFIGTFVVLHRLVIVIVTEITGFAPYAHYGVMAETVTVDDIWEYQKEYVGWFEFVRQNGVAIALVLQQNLVSFFSDAFTGTRWLHVGWLALPAIVHGLLRRGKGSLERRFAVFAGVALTAVALAVYGGYAARYPLLGVVCLWYLAAGFLEDAALWLRSRAAGIPRVARGFVGALPLVLVLAFALHAARAPIDEAADAWRSYRQRGSAPASPQQFLSEAGDLGIVCEHLDADAVVASTNPWHLYYWCGNAGLRIPPDLASLELLHRYLDEQAPGFLVCEWSPRFGVLDRSPRLERVRIRGRFRLYRVIDAAERSRPWRAPPSLATRFGVRVQ